MKKIMQKNTITDESVDYLEQHMLDLTQISDRVEVSITRASEQHLPPAERRGIYPTAAHQEYLRRATAETDRQQVVVAPYNRPLKLHPSIQRQPWRPLQDWRFCACSSMGFSIAAIGGYCVGLPLVATAALAVASAFAWRVWSFR